MQLSPIFVIKFVVINADDSIHKLQLDDVSIG